MKKQLSVLDADLPLEVFGDDFALRCPDCGEQYMRHGCIEIFSREEDEATVLYTIIGPTGVNVAAVQNETTMNPSSRRHGLRILFCCENCDANGHEDALKFLNLEHHKGRTFLSWERD